MTDKLSDKNGRVRVWTPVWWNRSKDDPMVECYTVEHHADEWFAGCPHEPTPTELLDSARSLCDEIASDQRVLEVIAKSYFRAWSLKGQQRRHINQWPLALIVLAGLREAGYDVVRTSDNGDYDTVRLDGDRK